MKISTIGTGFIVDRFLDAVKAVDGAEAYGVYSRTAEKAESFAEKHEVANHFTDIEKMLEDEGYDTVYVASPNSLHYKYARQALLNGKHVICEKPFTSTGREAKELVELSRARGLFLFEAVTTIHLPHFKEIERQLHRIGELKIIQANYSQYSSRYDKLKAGEVPNVFNLEYSGGALADLNIYNLNFVVRLLGVPQGVTYIPNKHENGVDTSGVCVLDYGGTIATCIGSKDTASDNAVLLQGDKGYIKVNDASNTIDSLEIVVDGRTEAVDLGQAANNMVAELEAFVRIFQNKDTQAASELLEHSLNVMETFEKARQSADIVYPADEG